MSTFSKKITWPEPTRWDWLKLTIGKKKQTIQKWKSLISQSPELLTSLSHYMMFSAIYDFLNDPDPEGLFEELLFIHLARTWHYHGCFNEAIHSISLPGVPSIVVNGNLLANFDVGYSKLANGVDLAIVLRDTKALEAYSALPFESFVSTDAPKLFSFSKPYFLFKSNPDKDSKSVWNFLDSAYETSEKTEVDNSNELVRWNVENLYRPQIFLWKLSRDRKQKEFNSVLQDLLHHHKKFHLSLPNGPNQMLPFLPLSILAPVCHAYDQGMKIEVQSDYLPEFLVRGDFPEVQWPELPHP